MNLRKLFRIGGPHYHSLVELNPDITVITCDGRIVFINRAGAQALGAGKPEELIGRPVLDFIHPDNRYVITKRIPHPQNQGQTIPQAEEKLVRLDGSVICVETTAMPITYQGRQATLVIGHDITARKDIEAELAEQENRFRAFTESTPDAILIVDYDTNILSWSIGAEKLFGYTKQEIIGKPSSVLLPAGSYREGHEQGVKLMHETAAPGKLDHLFESVGIKKDGTQVPIEISISLFETTGGTHYGAVIIRDITTRKQNEKLLTETNSFLNSIIENSPDGIVVADIDGVIMRVNSWFEAMLGFQKNECIGKYILDFFPRTPDMYEVVTGDTVCITEEFIENSRREMMRLFDEGSALNFETYLIRKDRRVIPVAQNVALLYDRAGDVSGAFGILRDISSHKQLIKELLDQGNALRQHRDHLDELVKEKTAELTIANERLQEEINLHIQVEQAMLESEEKFRMLAETTASAIVIFQRAGIVYANQAAESLCGYTLEELKGLNFWEVIPPDYREIFKDSGIKRLRGEEVPAHFEMPILTKNNETRWIDYTAAVINYQGTRSVLGTGVDITSRKLAEEALRKSEEQYRLLVEHANSIILRMDRDGVVKFFNEFAQKFFGFAADEIVGRNVVGTIVPETDSSGHDLARMIQDIGQRPELYTFNQNENTLHDGQRVWIAWTNKALRDDAGQVQEILCIGNDITLLKQTEEKLLTYQKQLQSLASELSLTEERERRRIAVDLHDRIAQSLAFARIKIDTIKSACGSDELSRMLTEVAELLGQTIQETRNLTIEICPPILYELGFEAALEWLSEQAQSQYGIKTSFANDRQEKPLDDDIRVVLFQAARELLVNVAKHAQSDTARLSVERSDNQVRISVEDDGIGFDMAAAETKLASNGGGFGLFSIRERLKHLGGSLELCSGAGRGTRISITAPLKNGGNP